MQLDYHIDLFSGIGGFSLGLKQAGFEFKNTYYSEMDKYAISIYRRHFRNAEYIGSVESVQRERIKGKTGIVTFGFPCQDLSIAGKRRGLGKGTRSSLFYEAMRIIGELRPDYFIFENVKGLFSSNNGKDFISVLREIADTGYNGQWILANTKWFLPQNRERVYFIGHITGQRGSEIFSFGKSNQKNAEQGIQQSENSGTINCKNNSGQLSFDSGTTLIVDKDISYAITDSGLSRRKQIRTKNLPPLRANTGAGHNNLIAVASRKREDGQVLEQRKDNVANAITSVQTDSMILSRDHDYNKGGEKELPCLRSSSFEHNEFLKQGTQIRRFTATECSKLQGFPDQWCRWGIDENGNEIGISDTQRYKTLGNAVSVPVVKWVAGHIKEFNND